MSSPVGSSSSNEHIFSHSHNANQRPENEPLCVCFPKPCPAKCEKTENKQTSRRPEHEPPCLPKHCLNIIIQCKMKKQLGTSMIHFDMCVYLVIVRDKYKWHVSSLSITILLTILHYQFICKKKNKI